MYYEANYVAGNLDPGFEVLTAFEMRHITNAPAANADLTWLRETMANTRRVNQQTPPPVHAVAMRSIHRVPRSSGTGVLHPHQHHLEAVAG